MYGLCCNNEPENVSKRKMQKKQGKKKLIVVGVSVYKVIENQGEKNENYTDKRGGEGFP